MAEKFRVMMHGMGKMGTAAYQAIVQQGDMDVLGAYDKDPERLKLIGETNIQLFSPAEGETLENAILNFEMLFSEDKTGVIVDFTSEEGCRELFKTLDETKSELEDTPRFMVTGTTPISRGTEKITTDIAKKNKIYAVRAPNFSINVNRFFSDMEHMAAPSPDDYISIHEIHRQEKASTSGTARDIAKTLCQRFGRTGYMTVLPNRCVYSASGEIVMNEDEMSSDRLKYVLKNPNVIKISAERFADEPGTHIVTIGNEKSYRQYTVRAEREDYGEGVVRSIRALPAFTAPGVYDFKSDVLQL